MSQTVVGLFDKSFDAQQAMQQLLSNGFKKENIDLSSGTAVSGTANTDFDLDSKEKESGVKKFFNSLFNDDTNEAEKFSKAATSSGAVITVHAQSATEAQQAADILDENGAANVNEESENFDYATSSGAKYADKKTGRSVDTTGSDFTTSGRNFDITNDTTDVDKSIPIIEENLEVGKRTVQTGGVRLKSRIVERPVEESVRLRQEYVRVERNPVNRAATDADFNSFKEGETEMIEHAEVPVVAKQARVVEEVSLGKEVNERKETIRNTVRKTEVDVEDIQGSTTTSSSENMKGKKGN